MALNEMIAQGAQFKMPDPLDQYGRIAQIQQAQNQNALAQYQINSAQRADETNTKFLNDLRAAGNDPAKQRQALINAGKVKEATDLDVSALTRQKTQGDIQKLNRDDFVTRLQDISQNSSKENVLAHMQDIANSSSYSPEFKTLATRKLTELSLMSDEDRAKITKTSGMTGAQIASANRPLASGGTVFDVNGKVIGSKPNNTFAPLNAKDYTPESIKAFVTSQNPGDLIAVSPKSDRSIANVNPNDFTPKSLDKFYMSGNYGDLVAVPNKNLGNEDKTPTVTTIQDPTNSSQMISINARLYRGGGIGSLGVIGLSGKTPAATAKQDAIDKGNAQLSSTIDDLRASYSTLEKAAAIPSTQRGVLSNLASSAQASGIGQALGRMGGTEEQSARDTINSSRLMLLNGIKTATGMSSQQLNSNMELKSWLSAVSDPTQSIETVSKVLDNIEKFVASGGKYTAKKEGAPVAVSGKPAPAAAGVAPPPGFKRD